ncbi:MAG: O-antigen ligase family protein [Acetobacteraceae bacterium]|nr:O-antigen ligase family protein [Acetobacteraceae bacterium]
MSGGYAYLPYKLAGIDVTAAKPLPGTQNLLLTAAQALILAGLGILYARRFRDITALIRQAPAPAAFLCLALASVAWSVDPAITLRRVFTLLTIIGFGYYLVARFSMPDIIRVVGQMAALAGYASIAVVLIAPGVGTMHGEPELAGAWSGVFTHKNLLGTTMIVALMTAVWRYRHEPHGRLLRVVEICAALLVLVMARSRTAQIDAMLLLPLGLVIAAARLRGVRLLWALYGAAIAGAIVLVLIVSNFEATMAFIGKDGSLTGRVPMWGLLLQKALERPFTGFGFGAFFLPSNPALLFVQRVIGWPTPEAHQGFIELALELGVPGLLLGGWMLILPTVWAFGAVRDGSAPWASFVAIYTVMLAVTNMLESTLLHPGSLDCMLVPTLYAAARLQQTRRIRDRRVGVPGRTEHAMP